jgi:hypothetical protein
MCKGLFGRTSLWLLDRSLNKRFFCLEKPFLNKKQRSHNRSVEATNYGFSETALVRSPIKQVLDLSLYLFNWKKVHIHR